MNTNLFDRHRYKHVILSLNSEDDRDAALRQFTIHNDIEQLCRGEYNALFLKRALEYSDRIILHKHNSGKIVGFAMLKHKKGVLDIILLCTIQNTERLGQMVAYSVFMYALQKKYKKIYVAPKTPELRETFIKYGFEHLRGIPDYDEILVKHIHVQSYARTNKTLRKVHVSRSKTIRSSRLRNTFPYNESNNANILYEK